MPRPDVWVVTPELHRRGGTERVVVEEVERWRSRFDVRVYAMSVDATTTSETEIRSIPRPPGPHIGRYVWWFGANRLARAIDARSGRPDAVVSPGVNALDADAIGVHMVFAKYWERVRAPLLREIRERPASPRAWHRLLFVQLIRLLERRVCEGPASLWSISNEDARELEHRFGRPAGTVVSIPHGVDIRGFDPARRNAEREGARRSLGLSDERVVLLVANDAWKKGLDLAVDALTRLPDDLVLAVAGNLEEIEVRAISDVMAGDRVRLWPHRADPAAYYAAADALVAPSREDSFNLPALEAMASGLPVVVSRHAGVSELVEDGTDALVVNDPQDAGELASAIERALRPDVREVLARNGRALAERTTWDENADRAAELVMREISMPRFLVLAADPFGVGGIERVTRALIGVLGERFGAERVGVAALWGGRADLPARILHRGRMTSTRRRVRFLERVTYTLSALGIARRWRRRLVIVACHPHLAPVAVAAGRLARAPVAVWCHGDEVWRPLRASVRIALQRADLVFAPSRFTAEQARRRARLERDPLVVPHAVPPEVLATMRRTVAGRVIAVARMERQDRTKGIDTLLRAWPKVAVDRPEAELVVVGDGSDRSRLEHASRDLGSNGRVRFTGRLEDAELRELYRTAAVFALPTRARVGVGAAGEGFGLVFAEAAAAGIPVVAGRSGAVGEVVEAGETGLLVDPMDPDAIADAIGDLLDDAKLRARMGRSARARAKERFSYESFGERIAGLLGGLAAVYRPDRD